MERKKELPELGKKTVSEKPKKLKLDFTKKEYEYILENCFLSDIQKEILEDRLYGKTIVEISFLRGMSVDNVNKQIRKIKNKILKGI